MRKIILLIIFVLCITCVNVNALELPKKTNHEKVTIYIFRGSGCSHCYDALEYFNNIIVDYNDYFEIKAYETWNNKSNQNLHNDVAKTFGDNSGGVPYIVIGESYHKAGFSTQMGDDIISAALNEYENKKYKDVVAEVAEDTNNKGTVETLEEACISEGIIETSNVAVEVKEKEPVYNFFSLLLKYFIKLMEFLY